jgi:TolB-like protein/Flp pilus assembly protein TadD
VEFAFGDHVLDVDRRELRRGAQLIALEPQVFDLLVYLVQNRDRVVSMDALLEAVWGGRIVSESTLRSRINAVRKAVGDSGVAQRLIRTMPRKGIRFVGVVREEQKPVAPIDAPPVAAENPPKTPLPLPNKPSIAVLPFANLSGDPEQEYFADGMVEEIITALSGIRWLFVIARNSTFTYKGKPVDVRQVGRELGVRYVLEGSVRKGGQRVRIAAQLIDATSGAQLWADRSDGELGDVFELQDRVAASVAGVIEPTLRAAEVERARHKRPESLDAYDLYLRAMPELDAMTAESNTRALTLLRRALELDPGYAAALAQAAICHMWRFLRHWMTNEEAESAEGVRLARASVAADREDPTVLANAGCVLLLVDGDVDTAGRLLDRAVALNPNSAIACGYSGIVRVWAGDYGIAIERCARAMRLSPLDPLMSRFLAATGRAHFCERRLEEAVVWMRRAQDEHPTGRAGLEWLVSTYAHLGRLDEARSALRHLLEESPQYTIAWNKQRLVNFKKRADAEFLLDGLRMAGLPEE